MRNETHSNKTCKEIVDLGATKHMTLHKATFDMYEVIAICNEHLDDDGTI